MKILNKSIITLLLLAYASNNYAAAIEVKEALAANEDSQLIKSLSNPVIDGVANLLPKEELLKLISNTKDLNQQTLSGTTALHLAAMNGHFNAVELLLNDKRCDVNIEDNDGFTALAMAVNKQNLEMVKLLLKDKRVKLETRSFKGKNHYLDQLKKLSSLPLTKENAFTIEKYYQILEIGGATPLMLAISLKNNAIVIELLNADANPIHDFITDLQAFLESVSVQNYEKLIMNMSKESPISAELKKVQEEWGKSSKVLWQNTTVETNFNLIYNIIDNFKTITYVHINRNILDGLLAVLKWNKNKNKIDIEKDIEIMVKIFKKLIKKGIRINCLFNRLIISYNEAKKIINYTIKDEEKSYLIIESLPFPSLIKILIENGANINQLDKDNNSVLDLALERNYGESYGLLVKAGAKHMKYANDLFALNRKDDDEHL